MADDLRRDLTARKMPWRPRPGQTVQVSETRSVTYGPDPLADPPRPPKWKVPGPLGAVVRLGSEEFQAIGTDGQWVVLICGSDGHVTRMDKATYEIAAGLRKPPERVPCPVLALVDGTPVSLSDCDWVLFGPCGCAEGLHVAAYRDGTVAAADEEAAWLAFYERKRERDKARRDGHRVVLMTHDRCRAEVTLAHCPHETPEVA
jgi:hypothetical protein